MVFGNISKEAIYSQEITDSTLEIAASLYFDIAFCAEHDSLLVTWYQNLLEKFSLETVLKSLARILSVSKEKKLTEHYQTAKDIFDKTTTIMNLVYRDIAVLTTGAKELEFYQDLKSHQLNKEINLSNIDFK